MESVDVVQSMRISFEASSAPLEKIRFTLPLRSARGEQVCDTILLCGRGEAHASILASRNVGTEVSENALMQVGAGGGAVRGCSVRCAESISAATSRTATGEGT